MMVVGDNLGEKEEKIEEKIEEAVQILHCIMMIILVQMNMHLHF